MIELSTAIPPGWETVSLAAFMAETRGVVPANSPETRFQLWSVPAFDFGVPEVQTGATIGSNKQLVQPGDVLLCKINPRINRVWIVGEGKGLPQIASTEWIVLRSGHADPRFLMHRLREQSLRETLTSNVSGVGGSLTRVRPQVVAGLEINLPPLEEQRRIASRIDELQARSSATRQASESIRPMLERFRQSVLAAAFRGDLTADWHAQNPAVSPAAELLKAIRAARPVRSAERTELLKFPTQSQLSPIPPTWCWTTLGFAFEVAVGATPSRKEPSFWAGSVPWVSSGEVAFCRIASTRESISDLGLARTSTRLHPPGTVLLGMIGEGRTRGQAAILDIPAANNQNSAAIRVSETDCVPEYVYYWLMLRYAETRRGGSGNNQQALNKSIVESIEFPLPPVEEQRVIVDRIEALFTYANQTRRTILTSISQLDQFDRSVLAKAFRGELVPQDPNDEPASVLLERIRAEREGAGGATRRGRKGAAR